MKPTNVVSMDFNSPEAMEEFIEMYERDALHHSILKPNC